MITLIINDHKIVIVYFTVCKLIRMTKLSMLVKVIEPRTQKDPERIFIIFFYLWWIFIMLRYICEHFSTITAMISFPWGRKHGLYAASFGASVTSCYIRNIIQHFTSSIYNHISAQCASLNKYQDVRSTQLVQNVLILKFYSA